MMATKPFGMAVKTLTNFACAAFAALVLVAAAPATQAGASPLSAAYVPAAGTDDNNCAITNPCRTPALAVSRTAAFDNANCLDSNGYSSPPSAITPTMTMECSDTTAAAGPVVINSTGTAIVQLLGLRLLESLASWVVIASMPRLTVSKSSLD
jgi:hypothetical protein